MIGDYFDCDKGDSDIIYDARGIRILHPLSGNLLTGECICIDVDDEGDIKVDSQGFPVVICKMFEPPLKMMPLQDEILLGCVPDVVLL